MNFTEAVRAMRAKAKADAADPAVAPGNRSLLLAGPRPARRAALLLHGFSAGPFECYDLARLLGRRGFAVWVPRLAGQGGSRADFEATPWTAWLDSARAAFTQACALGRGLSLVGHSCGGLMATLLAVEQPQAVERLVLAAPAFRTANPASLLTPLALVRRLVPVFRWNAREPEEARHWQMEYSTRALAELVRAQRAARAVVGGLRGPLLMVQAEQDSVISAAYNRRLFHKLPLEDKRLLLYPTAEHNVLHKYNPQQARILAEITAFLSGRS